MAGRLIEIDGSGDFTAGPSGVQGEGKAICVDCASQDEAYALALAYFPSDVNGIPRGSIQTAAMGGGVYSIDVDYSTDVLSEPTGNAGDPPPLLEPPGGGTPSPGGGNPPDGEDGSEEVGREVSFSLGGATKRVFLSKETIDSFAPGGGVAPNKRGLIGVSKQGIEGSEIPATGGKFTMSLKLANLSKGYFARVASMVGEAVNSAPFQGLDAGEVLLLQVDGSYTDADGWGVSYSFDYKPNNTNKNPIRLRLGDDAEDTVIEKAGHDLLDIVYGEYPDTVATIPVTILRPEAAYVERVYTWTDFSILGL